MSVSTALEQYRLEHVATKVVDRQRTEGIIGLLKLWFKDTAFEEVDIPACRAYADARMTGKLVSPKRGDGAGKGGIAVSSATCRRELGILQAAANHAARWKRVGPKASPPSSMPSIELPPGSEPRVVFLTKEEWNLALGSARGRLQDFMLVLYTTAARRRSVERLTLAQVDLRAGTINLTSPHETANERRSKKRRPVVPLEPNIRPIVERLMIEAEKTGSIWLWGDKTDMYTPFNEHMKACGLADKGFPHILRHSRASHLLMDGMDMYYVAKLLGDTIATVDRTYGHMNPDDLGTKLAEYGT